MNFKNVENAVLLIGLTYQSNAVGHADNSDLTAIEMAENPYLKIFQSSTGTFENLNVALGNNNSTPEHHGLEVGLAHLAETRLNMPIYMAKYAVGGTSLNQQLTGGDVYDVYYNQHLAPAINLLLNEGKRVFFVQCIWGGESNANSESTISAFALNFPELYNQYKEIFGDKVTFYVFEVAQNFYPIRSLTNDVYREIAKDVERFSVIKTGTLPTSDGVHFTAEAYKTASELLLDELESNEPFEVKYPIAYTPVIGGGNGSTNYEPIMQSLLNRAVADGVAIPSVSFQNKLNQFYINASSIISKLDRLFIYHNDCGIDFSDYNLVSPNTTKAIRVNSPSFTINSGINFNGVNQFVRTSFIPDSNSKYQKDNACFGFWALNNIQQAKYDCGVYDNSVFVGTCKNINGSSALFINTNTLAGHGVRSIGNYGVIGLNHFQRISDAQVQIMNAIGTTNYNSISDALPTKEFFVGGRNNNGALGFPIQESYKCFYIGESLTQQEYDLFSQCLTDLFN